IERGGARELRARAGIALEEPELPQPVDLVAAKRRARREVAIELRGREPERDARGACVALEALPAARDLPDVAARERHGAPVRDERRVGVRRVPRVRESLPARIRAADEEARLDALPGDGELLHEHGSGG